MAKTSKLIFDFFTQVVKKTYLGQWTFKTLSFVSLLVSFSVMQPSGSWNLLSILWLKLNFKSMINKSDIKHLKV